MRRTNCLRNIFCAIIIIPLFALLAGCGGGATGVSGLGGGSGSGGSGGGGGGGSSIVSATLSWSPVITNSDGSLMTDLAGYKVYYGLASGSYTTPIDVGNTTSSVITGLNSGTTYYFTVTAYDGSGNESPYATEVSKTL